MTEFPKRAIALCSIALSVAGCVTPEQLRQQDEATCVGFGFQPNTADFAHCLQRESLARRYQYGAYAAPPYGGYGPGLYPWRPYPW